MEEQIGNLIASINNLVKKLDEQSTGDAVAGSREQDGFFNPMDETKKENEDLAKQITEKQEKNTEKRQKETEKDEAKKRRTEKKPGRKILEKVTSVNIVDISDKAITKLSKIVPSDKLKKDIEVDEKPKLGPLDMLKSIGIKALALVVAPIVALVSAFQTIATQAWFLKLKQFVTNSKVWGVLKSGVGAIRGLFTTLGAKFPILGKLFGGVSTIFGKVFGVVKSVGTTVTTMVKGTKIFAVASKIGKFLGKLFLPLIIVWGSIKTVMGAIDGFKKDGVAGAIKGGVNALFDFLVGDLVKLLAAIPAWILKKIGLKNVAKSLTQNVDGLVQSIKDTFGGVVDTIVGVFTLNPKRIIKGIKETFGASKDFVGWAIGLAVDPVVNFLKDVFKWGDPDKPFSFKTDVLDPAVKKIKTWFTGLLALGNTESGWSLSVFINGVETKIKEFFIGIFTWAKTAGTNEEGEWNLGTFIGTVFENVKGWLVGMFTWATPDIVWSLVDKAKEVWEDVKGWFTGLITWAESDVDEKTGEKDGFIVSGVKAVIKSIKTWFGKLFKFDDTSSVITSLINITTWLPNLVVTGLGSISEWFARLFGFDEEADSIKEWNEKFSIGDLAVGAIKKVWEWFSGKFPDASAFLTKSWNDLTKNLASIGDFIWSGVKSAWGWLKKLWDDPKKTIETSWNTLTKNLASIGDYIWSGLSNVWKWFKDLWADPKKVIKESWDKITTNVSSVGSYIWGKISGIWDWITGKFPDVKTFVTTSWNNLTTNVGSIGSYIWGKISGIWDWITGKFPDVKTFVTTSWNNLTTNVASVGDYVWGKISGVWGWIKGVFPDVKTAVTTAWNNLTGNVANVGAWIGKKITGAWESLTSLFSTGDISSLIPDGLKDIGSFVWNNVKTVWDQIVGVFNKVADFDVGGYLKSKVKGTGGAVGKKVYDMIWGEEEEAEKRKAAEIAKRGKKLEEYGINKGLATKITDSRLAAERVHGGGNFLEQSEKMTESVVEAIGKGHDAWRLGSESQRALLKALRTGAQGISGTNLAKEIGDISKLSDYQAMQKISDQLKRMKDHSENSWTSDQVKDKYDKDLKVLGMAMQQTKLSERMNNATRNSITKHLKSVGSIELGGKDYKFDGTSDVTRESIDHLKKIYSDKDATSMSLAASLKSMGVTPEALQSKLQQQPLPSTNFELKPTTDLPRLNTDSAADDIRKTGDAVNKGTSMLREAAGDQFPRPSSPYAWEYIKMAGDSINAGSKALYEQSIEYEKSAKIAPGKESTKETKKLAEKLENVINILQETSTIQQKTLETLQEHGLIDKQGDTVVNSGGNSTTVNNITTESDIMTHRNNILSRIHNNNKY